MRNPFDPQGDSLSSYVNLQKRMLQKVKAMKVNDQIFEVVQRAFEDAVKAENIVLSAPERKRMLSQILQKVLEEMLGKLDPRFTRNDVA
jgi:hypothetical protein